MSRVVLLQKFWLSRYLAAFGVVGAELLIKLILFKIGVTTHFPFIFNELFTVVILAIAGTGPALLSVLLSSVFTLYFFLDPYNSLLFSSTTDIYGLFFAISESALVVIVATPFLEGLDIGYWRRKRIETLASARRKVKWIPYATAVMLVGLGLLSSAILLNRILAQYRSTSNWIGRTIEIRSRSREVLSHVRTIEFEASELARSGTEEQRELLANLVKDTPQKVAYILTLPLDDSAQIKLVQSLEEKSVELQDYVLSALAHRGTPSVGEVSRIGSQMTTILQTLFDRETVALQKRQSSAESSIERAAATGALVTTLSTFLVMVILATLFFDSRRRSILEDRLREAQKTAELANKSKTEFLANISHEIRTPLNGIVGLMGLLQTTKLDSQQKGYVSGVKQSSKTLISLINDILDFSKIEAGKMALEDVDFDLKELINEVRESYVGLFEAKNLKLSVITSYPPHTRFHADPSRIRQVLSNLLSNSLKFTEVGAVTVHVRVISRDHENAELQFSVSDTGIGLTDDVQLKLFQPFSQADASTARRFGGTGLGLAICKNLVELMGGTISVRSIVGQGSTFEFNVPVKHSVSETFKKAQTGGERVVRLTHHQRSQFCVLIAEDNQINQEITRSILEGGGYKTMVASNGLEAVQIVNSAHVDSVLMDCHMPEMDGYEATRRIREMKVTIPIIALTAKAFKEDQDNCFAAGMNGYLSKPVSANLLLETLDQSLADQLKQRGNHMLEEEEPIIDMSAIQRLAEIDAQGNGHLVQRLIGMYLGSIDGVVQELREHLENGDRSAARLRAHTLKSSSANLGGVRMARLLAEIEDGDLPDPQSACQQLKAEAENFCHELEKYCLRYGS